MMLANADDQFLYIASWVAGVLITLYLRCVVIGLVKESYYKLRKKKGKVLYR